jgi:hypothetical protein
MGHPRSVRLISWLRTVAIIGAWVLCATPALAVPATAPSFLVPTSLGDSITHRKTEPARSSDRMLLRVTGTVRDAATDVPVGDVSVTLAETSDSVSTSSDGEYTLTLAPGAYTLFFRRAGYKSLTLIVFVTPKTACVVDVGLERIPFPLPTVRVNSKRSGGVLERENDSSSSTPWHTSGSTVWSRAAMQKSPYLDQSDVLHVVETAPTAATRSEAPLGLHIDGGMADQNLVLLDGIPIENAVHSGVISSAINTDALETATLYDNYMPARFGGRLAGVVNLQTRGPSPRNAGGLDSITPFQLEGSAEYGGFSLMATGEEPTTGAFGFVSVRHSPRDLTRFWTPISTGLADVRYSDNGAGWSDELARGVVPVAGGELSVLGFRSQDAVLSSFPSSYLTSPGSYITNFVWHASASGVSWTGPLRVLDRATLNMHAWRSLTETEEEWGDSQGNDDRLINKLDHRGMSTDVQTIRDAMTLHVGGTFEHLQTMYNALKYSDVYYGYASDSSSLTQSPHIVGAVLRATAYIDAECHPTSWLTLSPGLRATYDRSKGAETGHLLEPRLGVVAALTPRLQAGAFYTRTTQPLQSLRNEESAYENIAALDLMSTRNNRIPEASSRLLSGTLTFAATSELTIGAGVYDRASSHLLMVPTSTNATFVLDSVSTGFGHALGWYVTATHTTNRLVVDAAFRSESVLLHGDAPDVSYSPSFAERYVAHVALRYHPAKRTDLRASFSTAGGRRTALANGSLTWGWQDPLGGNQMVAGTTETTNPGGIALPFYSRLDIGASHEITTPGRARRCDAATHQSNTRAPEPSCGTPAALAFIAIQNVLNQSNVGAVVTQNLNTTSLTLRPRTLVFGLRWWW